METADVRTTCEQVIDTCCAAHLQVSAGLTQVRGEFKQPPEPVERLGSNVLQRVFTDSYFVK